MATFLFVGRNFDTDPSTFHFRTYGDYIMSAPLADAVVNDFSTYPFLHNGSLGFVYADLSTPLNVDCLCFDVSIFEKVVLPDLTEITLDNANNQDLYYNGSQVPLVATDDYIVIIDYNFVRVLKRSVFGSTISGSGTVVVSDPVDLTPVLTQISTLSALVSDRSDFLLSNLNGVSSYLSNGINEAKVAILASVPNVDFTPVLNDLETIKGYTDTLEATVGQVAIAVESFSLNSLNGNGSEFADGTKVTVSGRVPQYTVTRSFFSIYSDNGYTVHYDLESAEGHKLTAPEALLTLVTP